MAGEIRKRELPLAAAVAGVDGEGEGWCGDGDGSDDDDDAARVDDNDFFAKAEHTVDDMFNENPDEEEYFPTLLRYAAS